MGDKEKKKLLTQKEEFVLVKAEKKKRWVQFHAKKLRPVHLKTPSHPLPGYSEDLNLILQRVMK